MDTYLNNGHDPCSPSTLNLRFHCPGSARLQSVLITGSHKKSTELAERGTKLHDIMEKHFKDGISLDVHDLGETDLQAVQYCAEMVKEIFKNVADQNPITQYEIQIDLSGLGISGGPLGCRIDVAIVLPGIGCIIIDYKFGFKWVTDPKFNWQLKAYAWGAHQKYGGSVQIIALQPANDEDRQFLSHTFDESEFEQIGKEIKIIVDGTKVENPGLCRGSHCKKLFCRNIEACQNWKNAALAIPYAHTISAYIEKISPAERQGLLNELKRAQSWINKARKSIEDIAISDSLEIQGYKVIPADEWQWIDETIAYEAAKSCLISQGKPEKIGFLIEPACLKSRSAVQKIVGQSKSAKMFLNMNTKKVIIEGKFVLEAIEDDIESIKLDAQAAKESG